MELFSADGDDVSVKELTSLKIVSFGSRRELCVVVEST